MEKIAKIIKQTLNIHSKHCFKIFAEIRKHNGKIRVIGGAVRDALLDIPSQDIDLATDIIPDNVIKILSGKSIKTFKSGIEFGTVTAIIEDEIFQITTLRKDKICYGRHAKVEFSKSFFKDALRRDFTINALSYCPIEHKIYDYFGGIEDLKNSIVRFIGDPYQRIKEDYLRILRFFRFSCKYSNHFHKISLDACIELKINLAILSQERIKMELDNLLSLEQCNKAIELMFNSKILEQIIPIYSLNTDLMNKIVQVAKQYNLEITKITRYSIIFLSLTNISIDKILSLKFSKKDAKITFNLISFIKDISSDLYTIDELLHQLTLMRLENDIIYFNQYFILAISIKEQFATKINKLYKFLISIETIPKFPINGYDLIELGSPRQNIGFYLKILKKKWVENNFHLTKDRLIKIAYKLIRQKHHTDFIQK
ncbi:CCA tRNA nucleotidyltransferase [Rickettsia endosymbiont of Cardiosporidium cionae]|uniref:CCA tRNA nucleotidyltransferase n=1 Tax=Rickettsia endosymbiont of Cardiosporidium cionae TaxID=2777155 RepID=UPI00189579E3|nr:CCA tRNA nucleotidyltransferase [Rickettsia endosymbiont of Cardiosporidium cionae]KAF8818225.1 CCA tRNA nucleotidyltransferase [Rickettsia endosymbiont of Cardiosporidium cionae]